MSCFLVSWASVYSSSLASQLSLLCPALAARTPNSPDWTIRDQHTGNRCSRVIPLICLQEIIQMSWLLECSNTELLCVRIMIAHSQSDLWIRLCFWCSVFCLRISASVQRICRIVVCVFRQYRATQAWYRFVLFNTFAFLLAAGNRNTGVCCLVSLSVVFSPFSRWTIESKKE